MTNSKVSYANELDVSKTLTTLVKRINLIRGQQKRDVGKTSTIGTTKELKDSFYHLPKSAIPNYRVVPEMSHSSGKAYNQNNPLFSFDNPTRYLRPMRVALSQSAPGLDCGCQEAQFGRDHGCIMKTVRLSY